MRNLRTFFLTGSIVLIVIILIVAFQNIGAQCNFITYFFFGVDASTPPTILVFIIALLGIFTGIMLMGLFLSLTSKEEDDQEF
jgi:hypothetical protein